MEPANPTARPSLIPSVLGVLSCAWAGYYVYSTERIPYGGAESVTLIKPLFYLLLGVTALMIALSLTDKTGPRGTGLGHWKRLTLVASLPVLGAGIYFFGFLLPSVIYAAGMTLLYGAKKTRALLLAVGVGLVLWLGFKEALGVPLPLWPR